MRALLPCLLVLLSLTTAAPARGQSAPGEARERIGLVLAGGGARGIAHAGVIRALEEFRIPVDAVAGTSMGALIGGLYAVGHDAGDLQRIIDEMDWRLAFEDTRSRREMSPRRKADDYDYVSHLGISIDGTELTMPIGIIHGQQVRLILKRLTAGAQEIEDFDRLPIPYRAVATDIETGEAYVFDHGDLVTAMRASMSIPGLLAPVSHDGRLLVDGGIASNTPVHVARAMGVDRLIVIDISRPLMDKEEIDNLVAVTEQTLNFLTRRNTNAELATLTEHDLVIAPDLGAYGLLEFSGAAAIYRIGYEAALAMRDELAPLALDEADWQAYMDGRRLPEAGQPVIGSIRIAEDSVLSGQLIRSKIRQREGEPLDREQLAEDIEQVYALGYWEVIDYELAGDGDAPDLVIRAQARGRGDRALKLGLQIASDLDRNSQLNLGMSYLFRGINRRGGEVYARAEFGNQIVARLQYYQPIDMQSRFFMAPWVGYQDHEVVSTGPELEGFPLPIWWRVREIRGEFATGLNLPFRSQFRIGAFRSYGKYLPSEEYYTLIPQDTYDRGGYFASVRWDDLDDVQFPRRGSLLFGEIGINREALGSDEDFERWIALGQQAFSFGSAQRNIVVLSAKVVQTDAESWPQNFSRLGGLFNLSGYGQYDLSGRQLALGVARYQYRIAGSSVLPFGIRAWLGTSFETGQVWREANQMQLKDLAWAGSLYLALESPFGPVHLAYGHANERADAFYLTVGWPFLTQDVRMER